MTGQLAYPKPCRYCGDRSYTTDDEGAAHPCCRHWMGDEGQAYCTSCRAARSMADTRTRRQPMTTIDPTGPRRRTA